MNDTFKVLAGEATTWCEEHAVGTPVAWEWEQKFAELIVQECTEEISNLMECREYGADRLESIELKAMRAARQVINEHFGIGC